MISTLTTVNESERTDPQTAFIASQNSQKGQDKEGSVQIWGFALKRSQFDFFQEHSFNIQPKCGLTSLAGKTKAIDVGQMERHGSLLGNRALKDSNNSLIPFN